MFEKLIQQDSLNSGRLKINNIIDMANNGDLSSFIDKQTNAMESQSLVRVFNIVEEEDGSLSSSGKEGTLDGYKRTPFIKVQNKVKIQFTKPLPDQRIFLMLYDKNKTFIKRIPATEYTRHEKGKTISLEIGKEHKYLRTLTFIASVGRIIDESGGVYTSPSNDILLKNEYLEDYFLSKKLAPAKTNIFNFDKHVVNESLTSTGRPGTYEGVQSIVHLPINKTVEINYKTIPRDDLIYIYLYPDPHSDGVLLESNQYTKTNNTIKFDVPENYKYMRTLAAGTYWQFLDSSSTIITELNNSDFLINNSLSDFINSDTLKSERILNDQRYMLKDEIVGGPNGEKLEKPDNGVVNFQVLVNTKIHDIKSQTLDIQDVHEEEVDHAVLLLPDSYASTGKPTQLIINCHGAGTTITSSTTNLSQPVQNLVKLGYAVLDVNGVPSSLSGGTGLHFGAPFAIQSYIKAYHYAISKYNLSREVFIVGTTLGGLNGNTLVQSGSIPVKAQANFCPVTDHFKQAWSNPWSNGQRKKIAQYFGFEGMAPTLTATGAPSGEENEYYKSNFYKIIGFTKFKNDSINWNHSYLNNIGDSIEEENYEKLVKYHHVPIKIWHNADDATVLPRYSKYYIDAIRRAGGVAYYREFPSGSHNAWDNGNTADLIDVNGVVFTATASTIELYAWLKRWE